MANKDNTTESEFTSLARNIVLGQASAHAIASLYQVASHSNGIAMENAVSNQQNMNQLNAVIVAEAVKLIKE